MDELLLYWIHWVCKPATELSLHTSIQATSPLSWCRSTVRTQTNTHTNSNWFSLLRCPGCWWYRRYLQGTKGGKLDPYLQLGRHNDMSRVGDKSLPLQVRMLLQWRMSCSTTHTVTFVSKKCFSSVPTIPKFQTSLVCGVWCALSVGED